MNREKTRKNPIKMLTSCSIFVSRGHYMFAVRSENACDAIPPWTDDHEFDRIYLASSEISQIRSGHLSKARMYNCCGNAQRIRRASFTKRSCDSSNGGSWNSNRISANSSRRSTQGRSRVRKLQKHCPSQISIILFPKRPPASSSRTTTSGSTIDPPSAHV